MSNKREDRDVLTSKRIGRAEKLNEEESRQNRERERDYKVAISN